MWPRPAAARATELRDVLAMHPRARATHALPARSRPAASQAEWVAEVLAHPDTAALRADAYGNLRAVAEVLRDHMDWASGLSRPTHAVIMRRTGLSRRSVTRWVRWLRDRGLLGLAVPGSTNATRADNRGGILDDGLGNLAAEYVLAVPEGGQETAEGDELAEVLPLHAGRPVNVNGAPSRDLSSVGGEIVSSESFDLSLRNAGAYARESGGDTVITWSLTATPRTKRDHLAACERLRAEDMTLRRLSARHLRSVLRPVLRQGVTPAEILHMINHTPDGAARPFTDEPRWVPAWLRWRLGTWWDLTGDGPRLRVEDLPSRRAAAAHEADLRAAAQRAAERAEALARRADASEHAEAARVRLAAASPRAAEAVKRVTQRQEADERGGELTGGQALRVRLAAARDQARVRAERLARIDAEAEAEVGRLALVEAETVFREQVLERHGRAGGEESADADRAWLMSVMRARSADPRKGSELPFTR